MAYVLYKHPIQYDTLNIVRYLHSIGKSNEPLHCIERNYPDWVLELPSIKELNGATHIGFENVVKYYENVSGITDLLEKVNIFKTNNTNYTIH
jgi:hypothetical protein